MKQTLTWFNLQRDENGNGLSNIKDTFTENLQLEMSVPHQSMDIFKTGLSSKEKVLDVSDPNKQHPIPKSSLHIHHKSAEELVKDELFV